MTEIVRTEVHFEESQTKESRGKITIEGQHDLTDPKKILQLMELLNLPKGTSAKVLITGASTVVR